MKKIFLALALLTSIVIASCDKLADFKKNLPAVSASDDAKVCCESFGYGSRMIKCCETYEWSTAARCKTPSGLVGGGRKIVDDSYCK